MSHTPEMWDYDTGSMEIYSHETGEEVDVSKEANARRIVACVNACEGITTEELESIPSTGGMLGPRADVARIAQQRDQLRAALHTQAEESAKLIEQRDELLAAINAALYQMRHTSYHPCKTEPMGILDAAIEQSEFITRHAPSNQ